MFLNSLLASSLFDNAEPVVIWLTVAIVGAIILAGVIMFFAKREFFAKYVKFALWGFLFYALAIGIFMLIANIVKHTGNDYLEDNWINADMITYVLIPLVVAMCVILLSGAAVFVMTSGILKDKKPEAKTVKMVGIILGVLCAAAVIAAGVTIAIYYSNHISDDGYYSEYLEQTPLYICAAVLVAALIIGAFILDRKNETEFDSHCIALAGICVALSFALSYVKLWEMPQGGSITLASLLPIMLFAYVYGPKKGILVGVIYGVLQALQDPYIVHPAQFLLDYPVAFAMVGLAGVFANLKKLEKLPQVKFVLGAILAGIFRFISHVLSGVFAFGAYASSTGMNFWAYSAAYNSFVFVDLIMVIVAGALLFSSKAFVKQVSLYTKKKEKRKSEETVESEEA